jgi:DNA-3-methyladenine glycosylase II
MSELSLLLRKAQRHLTRRDEVLQGIIKLIGPCTLRHGPDHFRLLTKSICSQQISTKAAAAIFARLEAALAPAGITAAAISKANDKTLRGAGLSNGKMLALRDLATKVLNGQIHFSELPALPDEEVIANLIQVRGIGRWTAEMFLIFALGRIDVLPVDDLGLRVGVQKHYKLKELPGKREVTEIGERWRPYRTVATWYFWRSLNAVPQPQPEK